MNTGSLQANVTKDDDSRNIVDSIVLTNKVRDIINEVNNRVRKSQDHEKDDHGTNVKSNNEQVLKVPKNVETVVSGGVAVACSDTLDVVGLVNNFEDNADDASATIACILEDVPDIDNTDTKIGILEMIDDVTLLSSVTGCEASEMSRPDESSSAKSYNAPPEAAIGNVRTAKATEGCENNDLTKKKRGSYDQSKMVIYMTLTSDECEVNAWPIVKTETLDIHKFKALDGSGGKMASSSQDGKIMDKGNEENLGKVMPWYNGTLFSCKICSNEFFEISCFRPHVYRVHKISWSNYKTRFGNVKAVNNIHECFLCGRGIVHSLSSIQQHLERVHNMNIDNYSRD